MLFAIDAGDQVAAADSFSNYPSDAPTTDLQASEPNIEAIVGYAPDLVVFADDSGDLESSLAELDIQAMALPAAATLDETYDQITQLGAATGHADSAAALVERMRSDIDKIVADQPSPAGAARTFYHELDDTYYSVTSETFIGQLYDLLGLRNIADDAPADAGVYPQLSSESIIDANPELIFLADTKCCGQSAATVAQRPGWEQIDAVANDAVIPLDDDVASRWGPRVVDLLRTIADAVQAPTDAGTP
jgi:iron complex transport system substrate-binding protein